MRPMDTSPEARRVQLELYRRRGGPGRLLIAFQLSEGVRQVARAGIRSRHPEYSPDQVAWALRRLLLRDDELFRKAWPGAPLLRA